MNITVISQLTLSSLIVAMASLATVPSASAFSVVLSGTFDDGGTISGTFDFDDSITPNGEYSNIDIITTVGSVLTTGSHYTDGDLQFFSDDGFVVEIETSGIILDLQFESSLMGMSPSDVIQLKTLTTEEDFDNSQLRMISEGDITAVPFEFNPALGLILVGSTWGISQAKKPKKL